MIEFDQEGGCDGEGGGGGLGGGGEEETAIRLSDLPGSWDGEGGGGGGGGSAWSISEFGLFFLGLRILLGECVGISWVEASEEDDNGWFVDETATIRSSVQSGLGIDGGGSGGKLVESKSNQSILLVG